MSRNIVDENGNLIQIAGKGIGVAEWGEPIADWLVGHTSQATAITADKDGVLVVNVGSAGSRFVKVYENGVYKTNQFTGNSENSTTTVPIRKGQKYYVDVGTGAFTYADIFYPFKENNNLQMVREKYSTEETVIGEYLGKPLYRIMKELACPQIPNERSSPYSVEVAHNMENIDKMFVDLSKSIVSPNGYTNMTDNFNNWISARSSNTILTLSCTAQNYISAGTQLFCLEYTKTTD